jgi:NADH dehydrogenase [ubiquinone] 1 alpha subcomplex assembly factor 5
MISPTDGSSLLSRAGFTLTTVDVEDVTVHYPTIWELMSDLRDMGESNAILGRRAHVSRDVLLAAEGIYNGEFASMAMSDER